MSFFPLLSFPISCSVLCPFVNCLGMSQLLERLMQRFCSHYLCKSKKVSRESDGVYKMRRVVLSRSIISSIGVTVTHGNHGVRINKVTTSCMSS
ncbi:hypothetical protein BJX99DRAFT_238948 [Aspergillus californicus]